MICEGLQNPQYILKDLKWLPDLKPGTYTLDVTTTGPNQAPSQVLLKNGKQVVASTPIRWQDRLPQTITVGRHLTFTIQNNGHGANHFWHPQTARRPQAGRAPAMTASVRTGS